MLKKHFVLQSVIQKRGSVNYPHSLNFQIHVFKSCWKLWERIDTTRISKNNKNQISCFQPKKDNRKWREKITSCFYKTQKTSNWKFNVSSQPLTKCESLKRFTKNWSTSTDTKGSKRKKGEPFRSFDRTQIEDFKRNFMVKTNFRWKIIAQRSSQNLI